MKLIDLYESTSKNMIIVDIQPFYHKQYKFFIDSFIKYLNSSNGNILWFHNGCNVGIEDTVNEIKMYLLELGLNKKKFKKITFEEKDYGFFRGWMDTDIDEKIIIAAGKYMINHNINDSRDLEIKDFMKFLPKKYKSSFTDEDELYKKDDPLIIPDINLKKLKKYNGAELMGGGKNECLEEIRLLLEMLNINYKLKNKFIY